MIKLIITHIGPSVEFLDLTISQSSRFNSNNLADITLFQKAQKSYLYLPQSSYHNNSVFKFTIKSEIRRYRLNCTNDEDFNQFISLLHDRLRARGYQTVYLNDCTDRLLRRPTIIAQIISAQQSLSNNPNNITVMPAIFQTFNTPREHRINLKHCLQLPNEIWTDPDSATIFPDQRAPIVCFKKNKNLKEQFIKSRFKFTLQNKYQLHN